MNNVKLRLKNNISIEGVKINPKTKRGERIVFQWENSNDYNILLTYKRPSDRKCQAFYQIYKEMLSVDGERLRITSYTQQKFYCAYRIKDKDSKEYLVYHTPDERFIISLD